MQRTVIILSFLLSLVLLTTAEQTYVVPSAPTEARIGRAKAAYDRWLASGTATAEEKMLVEEYLHFISPADEHDSGGNPLDRGGENCASAVTIPAVPFNDFSLMGYTTDCPIGAAYNDLYYVYTAGATGTYTAQLCGTLGATVIRVYLSGPFCCNNMEFMNANGCGDDAQAVFPLMAGTTAYIQIAYSDFFRVDPGFYSFQLTGPPPPPPVIQVDPSNLSFSATYVGNTDFQSVTVSNTGGSPLNVSNVTTTGDIWAVNPTSFAVNPGESQELTITFQPTVSHLFEGELQIFSSDPQHPRTAIPIRGRGCDQYNPYYPLPPPELIDAGMPSGVYIGFGNGGPGYAPLMGDWAVEVSTDNFASGLFLQPLGGLDAAAAFLSPEGWEDYCSGIIGGLQPSTPYQVRFRLRDCTGVETPGPSTSFTTPPPIVMRPLNTTLRLLNPSTLELNWDPVVCDTANRPLQNEGFEIYHQSTLTSPLEFVALSLTGAYTFPLPPDPIGFYQVQPIVSPVYLGPRPFIAWPPENATLSGLNTVVINDFYHLSEWDSFTVEMDGLYGIVLLGSSFNNPWAESDQRKAVADFSVYGSGPHTITVTVVPHTGNPITLVRHVNVIQPPHCDFTASYDAGRSTFSLAPANLQNVNGPVLDYYWQTTQFGDFWGPSVQFHWNPAVNESLTVVSVYPFTPVSYLTEEEPRYLINTEAGGIVPETVTTMIPWFMIECCCDNLELRTTGTADGTYYDRAGNATQNYPLGPEVSCDPATNKAHVGFAFEVVLTYKFKIGEQWIFCSSGQDCKRTDTDQVGTCAGGVFTATKDMPLDHKQYPKGTNFPADGPSYGNDDYRPSRHGGTWDAATLGKVRWIDIPHADFTLKNNRAIRSKREAHFVARADPNCPEQQAECCRSWDLNWDIVFCQNCSDIIHTQDPAITNEQTPANCPDLAGD